MIKPVGKESHKDVCAGEPADVFDELTDKNDCHIRRRRPTDGTAERVENEARKGHIPLAEEKEKAKAGKARERKEERLAALSPEDRLAKERKEAKRAEAEEAAWQRELAVGEAYRAKIKAELEAKEA